STFRQHETSREAKSQLRGSNQARAKPRPQAEIVQLEVLPIAVATPVNVLLAFEPKAVMAVMHTTMMRASMTAYSTAVGPSSRLRKSTTKFLRLFMTKVLSKEKAADKSLRLHFIGC